MTPAVHDLQQDGDGAGDQRSAGDIQEIAGHQFEGRAVHEQVGHHQQRAEEGHLLQGQAHGGGHRKPVVQPENNRFRFAHIVSRGSPTGPK